VSHHFRIRILGGILQQGIDRHFEKMGNNNWELVSVQKATQVLSINPDLAAKMSDEQLEHHTSPREVFVFFWKKPSEFASD
jgi:hypothetical protein